MKVKKPKISRFWHIALAAVLVWWGLGLLGVFDFDSANDILAIGAFITAALIIFDK
jgi:hypothetical protein